MMTAAHNPNNTKDKVIAMIITALTWCLRTLYALIILAAIVTLVGCGADPTTQTARTVEQIPSIQSAAGGDTPIAARPPTEGLASPAYLADADVITTPDRDLSLPSTNNQLPPTLLKHIPLDQPQFIEDMKAAHLSKQYGNKGWFFEPVMRFNDLGYPVFSAQCWFNPESVECQLASGEVVDEAYLAAHLPLVRNSDALRQGWACGQVCVDENANVVGKVSPEMIAWRDKNCSWAEYGNAQCN